MALKFCYEWTYTLQIKGESLVGSPRLVEISQAVYYTLDAARRAARKFSKIPHYKSVEVLAHFLNDKHGPPISIVWDRIVDGRDHTRTGEARKLYGT